MSESALPEIPEPDENPAAIRKLFPKDWLEIRTLALEGTPVGKIAKLYKVKPSSIYRGLKKRGIKMGAGLTSAAEVVENANRAALIEKIKTVKDEGYKFTQLIERRAMKVLLEAERDARPYASIADDLKALESALKIIRSGTDNKWKILGLDRENDDADRELPELPIRELTDHEIAAIRDKQIMEDDLSDDELEALEADIADENGEEPDDEIDEEA